jgi:hypothetical protein
LMRARIFPKPDAIQERAGIFLTLKSNPDKS